MYKYIILFLIGRPLLAQEAPVITNIGLLSITPETSISTLYDFENLNSATVSNDGVFYFYSHFKNDGLYTFDPIAKTSYTVFQNYNGADGSQKLKGEAPSYFYDVLFDNEFSEDGIELQTDMSISGTANFLNGIVKVDSHEGAIVFEKDARHINTSGKSYVDGAVEVNSLHRNNFVFPIGGNRYYRPAKIDAEAHLNDSFISQYYFENSNLIYPHAGIITGNIEQINSNEYWTVERMNDSQQNIVLTLTWDEATTPAGVLYNLDSDLHIVRWDTESGQWIDEGGIVNRDLKTVSTPTVVRGYGVFTLAKMKSFEDIIVVYNAVSPNGDGSNEYFFIENIRDFPNNTVQIFNRWGVKVYDTTNYDTAGNVFRGISEGRGTVRKTDKLPTGTYYYIISYEHKNAGGSRMVKKAGYLHLENN